MIKKLLRNARVFEMKGFSGHYNFYHFRYCAFKAWTSLPAS